jgi:hypothetical protein
MVCPNCSHASAKSLYVCPSCGQSFDRATLETLDHLRFLSSWLTENAQQIGFGRTAGAQTRPLRHPIAGMASVPGPPLCLRVGGAHEGHHAPAVHRRGYIQSDPAPCPGRAGQGLGRSEAPGGGRELSRPASLGLPAFRTPAPSPTSGNLAVSGGIRSGFEGDLAVVSGCSL